MLGSLQSGLSAFESGYLRAFIWLFRDAYKRKPLVLLAIMAMDALSYAALIAGFGIAYAFARALEADTPITVLRAELPQDSPILFTAAAIAAAALLIVSGMLRFYLRRLAIKEATAYELHYRRHIPMSLEALGPRGFTRFVCRYRRADLVRLLNLDSRYCALAVRVMLYRAFSVIVAIASTVFLVWLDSALALILALIALLSALPLWRTNKAASRYTREFEGTASVLAHETNRVIRSIMREVTSEAREPSDSKTAYGDEAVRRNIEAFEGRWLVLEQTQLINSTAFSIGLLALLIFVGYEVAIRGAPLTNILLYIAALRICMGATQNVLVLVTSLSRLYPPVQRYFEFDRFVNRVRAIPEGSDAATPAVLVFSAPHLSGKSKALRVSSGDVAMLFSPLRLDDFTSSEVLPGVIGETNAGGAIEDVLINIIGPETDGERSAEPLNISAVGADAPTAPGSYVLIPGCQGKRESPAHVEAKLEQLLECEAARKINYRPTPQHRTYLRKAIAFSTLPPSAITLFDGPSLNGIPRVIIERLMAEFGHSVSIIVHTNPKAKPIAKIIASALVSDGDQIRGWVEVGELEAHRSEIWKIMKKPTRRAHYGEEDLLMM